MRVGLVVFGRTGRAVASVLLESGAVDLSWVLRRSHALEHRSASEWLGIESEAPGTIVCIDEQPAGKLLDSHPVDVVIDFSSEDGIHYYGEVAAARKDERPAVHEGPRGVPVNAPLPSPSQAVRSDRSQGRRAS